MEHDEEHGAPAPNPDDGFVLEQTPPASPAQPKEEPPQQQPDKKGSAPAKPQTDLSKTVEDLQHRLDEQNGTLNFIARRFETLAKPAAPTTAPEPEEKDPDPAQLIEELSSQGLSALRNHGVLTRREVTKLVDDLRREFTSTINSAVKDSTLSQQFPELLDKGSQFTKDVAAEFDSMIQIAGKGADRQGILQIAARTVKARTAAHSPAGSGVQQRIDAQAPAGTGDDDDDMMSADASFNTSQLLSSPEAKRYSITPEKLTAERRRLKRSRG